MNKKNASEPKQKTLYTKTLTPEQASKLEDWLDKHLWISYEVAYAKFAFKDKFTKIFVNLQQKKRRKFSVVLNCF